MGVSTAIRTEIRGETLVITIDGPGSRNAFDFAAAGAMSAAIDEYEGDPQLRAAVVTGAGGTFCSGMDLKAFARGDVPFVERRGVFGIINEPPRKPLIAAVEGDALAGGLELLLVCDLIVAARDARLGIPEVKRGLLAASGGLLGLGARIPFAVAMEMALTGEPLDAARAHQVGLVNRLAEPGAALDGALELAGLVARNAPLAVTASKRILNEAPGWPAEDAWSRQGEIAGPVLVSEDAAEGASAFAERREPRWSGR